MILQLDIKRLRTLDEVRAFLAGIAHGRQRAGACDFVRRFPAPACYLGHPLLAEFDETPCSPCCLSGPSGPVVRRMMQRQYEAHGDVRFERLSGFVEQPSVSVFASR